MLMRRGRLRMCDTDKSIHRSQGGIGVLLNGGFGGIYGL